MAFDLVARLRLKDEMSAGLRKAAGEGEKLRKSIDKVGEVTKRTAKVTRDSNGRLRDEFGKFIKESERGGASFNRFMGGMALSTGGLGRAIRGVIGSVTSLKGLLIASGAVYTAVAKPLQLASDAEQANIAFTTMLGSAAKAKTFLTDLSNFANKTPFELPALRDASKRLLAFGFASKQIIPMMTGIGNAASGLGLGADGIDRITLALGQMKAKGRMQGDEAMALTEAGIPVWDILAKKMKLTTAQVIKLSEKGLIPADKAINVLVKGMNDRFPQMMDKQSKSLAGLWSTIKDTFNSKILTEWGNGIATGIKPKLDQLVTWVNSNGDTISRWGKRLQDAAFAGSKWISDKFGEAFKYVKGLIDDPQFSNLTFGDKIKFVFEDLKDTFDRWYSNGGSKQLSDVTSQFVSFLADQVAANSPKFIDIGTKIASGIISGVAQTLSENPLTAALVGGGTGAAVGGAVAGPAGAAGGAVIGAAAGTASHYTEKGIKAAGDSAYVKGMNGFYDRTGKWFDKNILTPVFGKHAGGLDRVPRNGYPAILHKDERVQTKAEADADRNGRNRSVLVTGNTFVVRQDSDIDAIALKLVRLMQQSEGARSIG